MDPNLLHPCQWLNDQIQFLSSLSQFPKGSIILEWIVCCSNWKRHCKRIVFDQYKDAEDEGPCLFLLKFKVRRSKMFQPEFCCCCWIFMLWSRSIPSVLLSLLGVTWEECRIQRRRSQSGVRDELSNASPDASPTWRLTSVLCNFTHTHPSSVLLFSSFRCD